MGTESFKRGIHAWEVNLDRVGNTRIGLARMPLPLDMPLHSRELAGEAWFVDYDGVVKHNKRGVLTELKQMLPISEEFQDGDTIGFHLDLRDNARFNPEDEESNPALAVGRGKLTLRFKGRSFLVASDLAGELEALPLEQICIGAQQRRQLRPGRMPHHHDLRTVAAETPPRPQLGTGGGGGRRPASCSARSAAPASARRCSSASTRTAPGC